MDAGLGMEMIPTAPAWRNAFQRSSRGLMMRSQRRPDLSRRTRDQNYNFALEVEAGKIVEIALRNA